MYLFLQSQNNGISGQRFGYGKKKFFDLLASSKRRQVKNKKFNAQSDRVKRKIFIKDYITTKSLILAQDER